MDTTTSSAGSSGKCTASTSQPNSTELMLALSQMQQLIPLLDYRPAGLTHLLPTLLAPLMSQHTNQSLPGETMQRYRANVDHAFRVAGELVDRVQDNPTVGPALELAERLMKQGDSKARMLRVRKKRRLFTEQEKVLETNTCAPPIPVRVQTNTASKTADEKKEDPSKVHIKALLPSQNPNIAALAVQQQSLSPPRDAKAVQGYLAALHAYLKTAEEKGLMPPGVPLKQIKARVATFNKEGFALEVHLVPLLKAFVDATSTSTDADVDARDPQQQSVRIDLAGLTVGGIKESITLTRGSAYPIFRTLSSDILTQTHVALSSSASSTCTRDIWTAYKPITEAIARLILAAAQFQA
ncbi:hypothetical protein NDA11_001838 [Ustilago hordei]|nr:hypothetical protein NDA11_001838 [Ustilago hordei]KAJ1594887.1 hypothetical protein NDA14_000878 [Ustilago hordei]UTT91894.1 hypothetical protein NDA17_004658 [Ustilago hordei]